MMIKMTTTGGAAKQAEERWTALKSRCGIPSWPLGQFITQLLALKDSYLFITCLSSSDPPSIHPSIYPASIHPTSNELLFQSQIVLHNFALRSQVASSVKRSPSPG